MAEKKKAPGALDRLHSIDQAASGSKVLATAMSATKTAQTPMEQGPYLQAVTMEPATRIERSTLSSVRR